MKKLLKPFLIWLPSLMLSLIFVPNALEKISSAEQLNKVVSNPVVIVGTGIFLLIATGLFLYQKTVYYGASFLIGYYLLITGIHMYKGKPHEVVALIVVAIVFATYVRVPDILKS